MASHPDFMASKGLVGLPVKPEKEIQIDGLTVGRIVHYVLTEDDAKIINKRRKDADDLSLRLNAGTWPLGAQAHVGNQVAAGDHVAAMVVAVWGPDGYVNLKCLLDGNDDYWATSIHYESGEPPVAPREHTWHWIESA